MASPAEAAFCRTIRDRTICILSIQRSAKYFWEYQAVVRIDNQTRPRETYNCRDRLRIREDGIAVPFDAKGVGELICTILKR